MYYIKVSYCRTGDLDWGSNHDKNNCFVFTFFQEGISALMLGTANNRLNCVKILLQEGADPQLKSKV